MRKIAFSNMMINEHQIEEYVESNGHGLKTDILLTVSSYEDV
jgi:hypothetical protein